jgi:two-component system, chemotaxis family, CheB/CheR fusion protein
VIDEGIGIEPDAIAAIFEPFTQEGRWVTQSFGGLGLGLTIARATVDAHGGTLSAQSRGRNQGSTFVIELPRQDDES